MWAFLVACSGVLNVWLESVGDESVLTAPEGEPSEDNAPSEEPDSLTGPVVALDMIEARYVRG